jgi:hypothetical protein
VHTEAFAETGGSAETASKCRVRAANAASRPDEVGRRTLDTVKTCPPTRGGLSGRHRAVPSREGAELICTGRLGAGVSEIRFMGARTL